MKTMGGGCLALFGLPFLLAGLFVMYLGLSNFWIFWLSGSWVQVPATIERVQIEESTDSEGDSTYALKGSYTYQYEGRTYTGSRIVIDQSFSNFHGQLEAMKGTLEKHRALGKPIDIRVDPKNPERSLVYRDISPTMMISPLFGLVFALTGLGVCGGGWNSIRSAREFARRQQLYPEQPWKWEGHWDGCRATHHALWPLIGTLGATVFGNSFVWVFVVALWADGDVPGLVAWGAMLVGCVGLLAFVLPYWALRHYLRYGAPTLLFEQVPVQPGETMRAVLQVKSRLLAGEGVKATLYGNRLREESDGDGTTTVTTNLWTETLTVKQDLSRRGGSSAIPIVFQIPANMPQRDMYSEPKVNWRLDIEANVTGLPFRTDFEIPVFRCPRPELIERRPGSEGIL